VLGPQSHKGPSGAGRLSTKSAKKTKKGPRKPPNGPGLSFAIGFPVIPGRGGKADGMSSKKLLRRGDQGCQGGRSDSSEESRPEAEMKRFHRSLPPSASRFGHGCRTPAWAPPENHSATEVGGNLRAALPAPERAADLGAVVGGLRQKRLNPEGFRGDPYRILAATLPASSKVNALPNPP